MRFLIAFLVTGGLVLAQSPELARRIKRTDPSQYGVAKNVHMGAGEVHYMPIVDAYTLSSNLLFVHRGVILPKSGIGHHFHNQSEELYLIFDGEAEFTIDGRTALHIR